MKPINKDTWDNAVEYGDFERLPAGGYVCAITDASDVPDKEYLEITYDIAEGVYADFYSDEWGKEHPWAHRFVRSYKEKAMGMMKGFLKAVDESNGTDFSSTVTKGLDEHKLIGKLVGLILREEEYESNRGDIRTRLIVHKTVSIDTVRSGNFKIPDIKRLNGAPAPESVVPGFGPVTDNDMPF